MLMSAGGSTLVLAFFHHGSVAVPSKLPFLIRFPLMPPAADALPPALVPPAAVDPPASDPPLEVPPLDVPPPPSLAPPAPLEAVAPPEPPFAVPPAPASARACAEHKQRVMMEENVANLRAEEGTTM